MVTTASDFFIVDNSDEHWKALEYLRQWCAISSGLDVATGHFEIGALLALDGEWQKIPKIRLLIGGPTSRTTVEAVRLASQRLDESLAGERATDPFLRGLPAVVAAIRTGQIAIKVYRRRKFHAKAYITHGSLDVVGSAALVGSANFTRPGLTQNIELNVRFTGVEVRELQEWYDRYWDEAEDVSPELLTVLERFERPRTPFEVYCRALQVLTENVTPGEEEWETTSSVVYPLLAPYQRDAYLGLKQRARSWGGGFLTDGVGLGKTFVGLMLTEYFAMRERKNVLIMATKTGKDAVWEPEIARHLPNLRGDFTNLKVMAHTDLSTRDAMEQVQFLAERADVVIIDEAHNFRNLGVIGPDPSTPKSRWYRMAQICRGKTTFLLTATPINNTLFDFVHELQLFTGMDQDSYFADLGIGSLRTYIQRLERTFEGDGHGPVDMSDFEELLARDQLLKTMIVQNSRMYAVASSKIEGHGDVRFPEQMPPKAVPYDYDLAYSALLHELEAAFEKDAPLFVLPMYYPLAYSRDENIDPLVENRQRQVVGLIRTVFLKRFESSIAAFTGSCLDMSERIASWITENATSVPGAQQRLTDWRSRNAQTLTALKAEFRPVEEETEPDDEDTVTGEESELEPTLDPADFRLAEMIDDAFADLEQMAVLLAQCRQVGIAGDTKYDQLKRLLLGPGAKAAAGKGKKATGAALAGDLFDPTFVNHKVLVFTEFADTARYLHQRLKQDGLIDVDRLDGSRKGNRVAMIRRFAPHYNSVSPHERKALKPLRVLISTDVLSEGVNLQDATQIVNYDIHWNPVRLMQRIGRVDRRLNAQIEASILAEDKSAKEVRGHIGVRNFLPNAELNQILSLYTRVQSRVLRISKTLGIPGGKLLDETDMLDDTRVFQAFLSEYRGDMSPTEKLRLKLLGYLDADPTLGPRLAEMPPGIHAAKAGATPALFTCTIEPARSQNEAGEVIWTRDPGRPRWALHTDDSEPVLDLLAIDDIIACEPGTPAVPGGNPDQVAARLLELGVQRRDELLREQLPLDDAKTTTACWLEVRP